jgi:hypothetical protein
MHNPPVKSSKSSGFGEKVPTSILMSEFRTSFDKFCRVFNGERSSIVPLISMNTKGLTEMQQEARILIENVNTLCRVNYIFHSRKCLSLSELCLPLSEFKTLGIAASLRLFTRPNHKDRFSHLINFLVSNPEIFSQVTYFYLVRADLFDPDAPPEFGLTADDRTFFCFNTFPCVYLYFLTHPDRANALSYISSLFKLHFFLHNDTLSPRHEFLRDLVFSYFLVTNPGKFFDSAVLPLLPFFRMYAENRPLSYSGDSHLIRHEYWKQVVFFVERLLGRLTLCVALLPEPARHLAALILDLRPSCPSFKYHMLVETCIGRYLMHYIDSPDKLILRDSARALFCIAPIESPFPPDARSL